jgi:hypothetical protein
MSPTIEPAERIFTQATNTAISLRDQKMEESRFHLWK